MSHNLTVQTKSVVVWSVKLLFFKIKRYLKEITENIDIYIDNFLYNDIFKKKKKKIQL